tara:strand:+ start:1392 stop:1673 length:282 start_codon:yes stop_codon:yes gene_type:complete
MTAPDTNTDRQKKRHWPPLLGMALVVVFGVGIIIYWVGYEVTDPADYRIENDAVETRTTVPGNEQINPAAEAREVEPAIIDPGVADPPPSVPD